MAQRRAIWLLGLCQCLLWGALYYSFPVLLLPLEVAWGLPRPAIAAAFSGALLVAALGAPAIGRRLDRGEAAGVFRAGIAAALLGLAWLGLSPHAALALVGWVAIGIAMAMLLYDPAFALVTRAIGEDAQRLRALSAVTVLGGLASTVSVPLLSLAVEHTGWRSALLACAVIVLLCGLLLLRSVVPAMPATVLPAAGAAHVAPTTRGTPWPRHLPGLAVLFSLGTFSAMALTTLQIPMLIDRGIAPTAAASVLAVLGLSQLPGRIWLAGRAMRAGSRHLQAVPLVLQGLGLLGAVAAASVAASAAAVALFGLGAGLQTVLRPWAVGRLCPRTSAGRWNGEVARWQGFARAAGPVLAAGAAWLGGSATVLATLGFALLAGALFARRLPA